mgnify:CR=1 FL=1
MCLTKKQTIKWFKIINWQNKMLDKISKLSSHNWKKHKKYQYLYLQKKIDFIEMEDRFDTESTLFNEELGQSLSKEEWEKWEQNGVKIICKVRKYRTWLNKINRKYNYA